MQSNLEKEFLEAIKEKQVRVYLDNSYQEHGRILKYDDKVIMLDSDRKNSVIMVYKDKITTIALEPWEGLSPFSKKDEP